MARTCHQTEPHISDEGNGMTAVMVPEPNILRLCGGFGLVPCAMTSDWERAMEVGRY